MFYVVHKTYLEVYLAYFACFSELLTYQRIIYERMVGLALAQGCYSAKELEHALSLTEADLLETLHATMQLLCFYSFLPFLLILLQRAQIQSVSMSRELLSISMESAKFRQSLCDYCWLSEFNSLPSEMQSSSEE